MKFLLVVLILAYAANAQLTCPNYTPMQNFDVTRVSSKVICIWRSLVYFRTFRLYSIWVNGMKFKDCQILLKYFKHVAQLNTVHVMPCQLK
jgi:hypothetical protein